MGAAVQLVDGGLKSTGLLPPRIMVEILRGALPELVRVTLSGWWIPVRERKNSTCRVQT